MSNLLILNIILYEKSGGRKEAVARQGAKKHERIACVGYGAKSCCEELSIRPREEN